MKNGGIKMKSRYGVFALALFSLLMLFYSPMTEPKSAETLVKYIEGEELDGVTLEIYSNPYICSIIPMDVKALVKCAGKESGFSECKTVVSGEELAEKSFEIASLANLAPVNTHSSHGECHGHVLSYCAFKNRFGKTIFDFSMPYFDSDGNQKILLNGNFIDYEDAYESFLALFVNG